MLQLVIHSSISFLANGAFYQFIDSIFPLIALEAVCQVLCSAATVCVWGGGVCGVGQLN